MHRLPSAFEMTLMLSGGAGGIWYRPGGRRVLHTRVSGRFEVSLRSAGPGLCVGPKGCRLG